MEIIVFCTIGLVTFGLWVIEKITHKHEDEVVTLRNFRVPDPIEAKKPDSHDTAKEIEEWANNVVVSAPSVSIPVEMNSQFEEWEPENLSSDDLKNETSDIIGRLFEFHRTITKEVKTGSWDSFGDSLCKLLESLERIVSIRQLLEENTSETLRPCFYDEVIRRLNKNQSYANELCKGLILTMSVHKKMTEGGLYISNPETIDLAIDISKRVCKLECNLKSLIRIRTKNLLSTPNSKQVTAVVPFTTSATESFDAEFKVV